MLTLHQHAQASLIICPENVLTSCMSVRQHNEVGPWRHMVSQLDPGLSEDVLCAFTTNPSGYLTTEQHRLAVAPGPAAAMADIARLLQMSGTGSR